MAHKKKKSQGDRLVGSIIKKIESMVGSRRYQPKSADEINDLLNIPDAHSEAFDIAIKLLINEGELSLVNGLLFKDLKKEEVFNGVISMHSRGFGFVTIDRPSPYQVDIFIPRHLTQNAVDRDRVEVVVTNEDSGKGPEGRVVAITKRTHSHIAGVIERVFHNEARAYVPLLGENSFVKVESDEALKLKRGDRVVMEVLKWGDKNEAHQARATHTIGSIDDPSCDVKAAIEEFSLRDDFPIEVVEEAKRFGREVTKNDLEGRVDYRDITALTIDPDTAKDFDDAISISKTKSGYELIVHIADVSYYVKSGSNLDKEAFLRCNSTYFPGSCIPMLPEALSNELCSLKPDVDRLTLSVVMQFNNSGELTKREMHRGVIRSRKRFTYKGAFEILKGKSSPFAKELKLMEELCLLLKKQRKLRGSIEFNVPELAIRVDEEGHPEGFDTIEYDITHQMIEEFMLKANESVATHLDKKNIDLTFRVHEEPDQGNIDQFVKMAAALGFKVSTTPDPTELQELFTEASKSPFGPFLITSYIRSMKLAHYSANNIGHFGLSLTHYCHFTSPIRRYSDLVVHRILMGEEETKERLDEVSKRASERERISAKAEGHVKLIKKLRYLQRKDREDPYSEFEAVVVKIKPAGIAFEILGFELSGFLPLSEIAFDYFTFDEKRQSLYGRQSKVTISIGDKLTMLLQEVDLVRLDAKWYLMEEKLFPKKRKKR